MCTAISRAGSTALPGPRERNARRSQGREVGGLPGQPVALANRSRLLFCRVSGAPRSGLSSCGKGRPVKTYTLITGALFGLLTVVHLWRVVVEGPALARDPWFVGVTLLSALLCAWAFRLARRGAA